MTKIFYLRKDYSNYGTDDRDGIYRGDMSNIPDSMLELSAMEEFLPWKKLPEVLEFDTSKPTRLKTTNYPHVDVVIDIFSNELIQSLSNAGNIDWTLVPVRFFDRATGEEVCAGRFSAVFFDYHCDFFDYELSDFEQQKWSDKTPERVRKKVSTIKKMMLKKPKDGFPPFFYLLADPKDRFITEAAHNAIVESELEGVEIALAGEF